MTETAGDEAAAGETGVVGQEGRLGGLREETRAMGDGGRKTTMSGELRIRESAKRDGLFRGLARGTAAVGEVP